jgi:hypothetical protein
MRSRTRRQTLRYQITELTDKAGQTASSVASSGYASDTSYVVSRSHTDSAL